ncbi:hypothetical protein ACFVH6_42355 [Spirillospora sp. NPDC127200]
MARGSAEAQVGARWSAARRFAGYGAASSMSLYLVVKVVWGAAAAFGHAPDDYGTADWAVLNAVTVVMAATGVALGLALAQRWGRRPPWTRRRVIFVISTGGCCTGLRVCWPCSEPGAGGGCRWCSCGPGASRLPNTCRSPLPGMFWASAWG